MVLTHTEWFLMCDQSVLLSDRWDQGSDQYPFKNLSQLYWFLKINQLVSCAFAPLQQYAQLCIDIKTWATADFLKSRSLQHCPMSKLLFWWQKSLIPSVTDDPITLVTSDLFHLFTPGIQSPWLLRCVHCCFFFTAGFVASFSRATWSSDLWLTLNWSQQAFCDASCKTLTQDLVYWKWFSTSFCSSPEEAAEFF